MDIILFNGYVVEDNLNSLNYLIQENECEACKHGKYVRDLKYGGGYWHCDDGKKCYDKNTKKHLNFIFSGIKEMKCVAE